MDRVKTDRRHMEESIKNKGLGVEIESERETSRIQKEELKEMNRIGEVKNE